MKLALIACLSLVIATTALAGVTTYVKTADDTFTVWQLPSQTPSQMMSYVIKTLHGKIMVIDGGMKGDASYLRGFLAALGNRVDYWFITHPHDDHIGALTVLLESPRDLKIEGIYASLPTVEWLEENDAYMPYIKEFYEAIEKSKVPVHNLYCGSHAVVDGVHLLVLGVKNPEIHVNLINNQSLVMRVWDEHKSILFTGDLGVEGGEKLLHSKYAKYLPSDYVQMAHHGQTGVDKAFYEAVHPKYCLWPTPKWLWDNNAGHGPNTGPWRTIEVRLWMKHMNVERDFPSWKGLVCIH